MSDSKIEKVVTPEAIRWIEGKEKGQAYFRAAWNRALEEARRDQAKRRDRRNGARPA